MRFSFLKLATVMLVALAGCTKTGGDTLSADGSALAYGGSGSVSGGGSGSGGGSQGGGNTQPGVITAGEWNDLDNWHFFDSLLNKDDYRPFPGNWKIYNNNRVSVLVKGSNNLPANNIKVALKRNGSVIYSARTDNFGKAELWADIFTLHTNVNYAALSLDINNGGTVLTTVKPYSQGVNEAIINTSASPANRIEIAFVVDATGSMGDELSYLKTELSDVITRVKTGNVAATVATSSVFYRDEGDEYVTRVSDFSTDQNTTINFIRNQNANGGGDFPEAVHSALEKAVNNLNWSDNAKTRILFLLLDAPPHAEQQVITSLQGSIQSLAKKGVKVVPITASGIHKETEFLMRFFANSTNGTYVFITNHSGIGNVHIEATVGNYEVEYLNNLMVRLVNKYSH